MGESSRILLGAILGGMMAFDMGGPLNKAAYIRYDSFSTSKEK